jgi:catechol 2,3-dioxygenase-like lactoylglutathione lyase family enzyme
MLQVTRIGHATFETPDIERQIEYQVNVLGLSVAERGRDHAIMKTALGQLTLILKRGDAPRCTGLAFQVDPSLSADELRKRLMEGGIRSELRNDSIPGIGETLSFKDPQGTTIEVFAEARLLDEDRSPKAFLPLKLGHLAFKAMDMHEMVKFYDEVLGFRVSDWRKGIFVWMRCGPDHHTVNFAKGDMAKMHHIAFELADRAEILRACDFLGRNKYHIIWGPGRHIIGDNIFTYHRDPDGHIIELYAEMARIDSEALGYFVPRPWRDDRPYKPTDWSPDTLTNLWGPGAPPGFGD